LKGPPKWVFLGNIGGRGKDIWWEPPEMQRPPIYAFSNIFGPDLTRRVSYCIWV